MITVVVVHDEHLVRSGFAALLSSDEAATVLGAAADGDEALDVVRRLRPDVVLMDIRVPGRDGVSATAAIAADPDLSRTRVIVLTTFDLDEYVHAALRAGASGFLLKDAQPRDLLDALHLVAQGESVLAPVLVRRLIAAVARGLSNAEIGAALHMSSATAKTHVSRLLANVGARDRTQLVIAAYDSGLMR